MKELIYTIKNTLYRGGMRIFMPDLARQMAAEGNLALPKDGEAPSLEYIKVEDNGADTTIFAFSGLDVLYAGLARYEFQRVLHQLGTDANFVFVRDVHRMGFQLKPDGSHGGMAFYRDEINRVKAELGSSRNIAIGSSIGGSAAFCLGSSCGLDELVLFGAAFNLDGFSGQETLWKVVRDYRLLLREPRAYFELLVVTFAARWALKNLEKRFGIDNIPKPLEVYDSAPRKPAITLLYGESSAPDVGQAELIRDFPRTRLVPLPTGRHNTPAFLKERGELADRIAHALANPPVNTAMEAA